MITSKTLKFFIFSIAVSAMAFTCENISLAQQPALKKLIKKQQQEAERKAEELKKLDEQKRKKEQQKSELAKSEKGTKPEKFVPNKIGDLPAVVSFIDQQIEAKQKKEEVTVGQKSSDSEFLRRVYLDLTGAIPTVAQAREFLDDSSADKRVKLIDKLLATKEFGEHQSDVWLNALMTRSSDQRRLSFEPFREWLAKQFNDNRTWAQITSDIVSSEGTQEKNPAVTFFLANPTVDKMTDTVSKVFLGVSIQCAQCHDHKFEDWKQTEYWSMAQFFYQVQPVGVGPGGGKNPVEPAIEEVKSPNRKRFPLPEDAKDVPARFLRDGVAELPKTGSYRPSLSKWMTGSTNPYFAKAFVNRVWAQFFNIGIVDPIDDMGPNSEPSHPELLNKLAANFAADQFNVKNLIKSIMLSKAYQLSSKATLDKGDEDAQLFAKMSTKVMTPEQLYDSVFGVLGIDYDKMKEGIKKNLGNKQIVMTPRDRFVDFFLAGQEMANTMEYEVGIPQAMRMMNSKLTNNTNAAKKIVGSKTGEAAIEELYLATLSRKPSTEEKARMKEFMASTNSKDQAISDILWVLLNSSEFTLVR